MVIRATSIVLRTCGILALLLGIVFWTGNALNLIPVHMLLGLVVVLSLWIIGVAQAFSRGGSWVLAASALVLGVLVLALGVTQTSLMVGSFHWVIRLVHLLLGALAVGIGQISASRYQKGATVAAAS